MRDTLDEMSSASGVDGRCAGRQQDRFCEEREQISRNFMGRQRRRQPENATMNAMSPPRNPCLVAAVPNSAVGAHEQAVYDAKRGDSGNCSFLSGECRQKNALNPGERRPYLWKGLGADVLYFSSDSLDDVDLRPLRFSHGSSEATTSDALSPHPQALPLPLSGGSRYRGRCWEDSGGPLLHHTSFSAALEPRRRRVPENGSPLPRANLGPAPVPARVSTNLQYTSMCVPTAPLVQEKTFWINVWPCFGSLTSFLCKPTRILVHGGYRYMEQLTEKAGTLMNCRPAPSVLYEPHGRPLRSLAQLLPEQHYLFFPSGGFYRKEAVPVALLVELVKTAKLTLQQRSRSRDS
ncbi:uncharacterized protein Tco025E_02717 [Trypanosoma conorhini]|uniref:Uncharacterized protein n=1 Tax=Trypanosoma conorhini TaxID=83891 RepID=A0A422Q1C9_9TRYP|nr:uncharacterized protein Tco025E_02717 [Trypanosoma conorhini]RNF23815.1 hypothetical protein Tco025E_02717 [Trypanosoma conorhini]